MIEPALRDRLIALYANWLDHDELGPQSAGFGGDGPGAGITSVRQFLEALLRWSSGSVAPIRRPAALEHPDSTFSQLLGSRLVGLDGPPMAVEALALHELCFQVIPRLMVEACSPRDPFGAEVKCMPAPPAPDQGPDRHGHVPGVDNPADLAALADALMVVLKSRLGARTIRSFFAVEVAGNGYRLWEPGLRAPPDAGTALQRRVVPTDHGGVSVDVMRYTAEEDLPVRAYEWCAELHADASSALPDAVACGMAYRFDRRDGAAIGGPWDLMTAADTLADVDLLQVNAFLEQHPDAEALIDAGDLVFVWLWERRNTSRAGAGQACLRAALTDLCRRQRRIRTVVIDLKPYQFVVSDAAGMPGSLHVEKLDALDRLQSFVDGLQLGQCVKGQCRYIVNRDGDSPAAALRALGLAGLAQQKAPGQNEL